MNGVVHNITHLKNLNENVNDKKLKEEDSLFAEDEASNIKGSRVWIGFKVTWIGKVLERIREVFIVVLKVKSATVFMSKIY